MLAHVIEILGFYSIVKVLALLQGEDEVVKLLLELFAFWRGALPLSCRWSVPVRRPRHVQVKLQPLCLAP